MLSTFQNLRPPLFPDQVSDFAHRPYHQSPNFLSSREPVLQKHEDTVQLKLIKFMRNNPLNDKKKIHKQLE